MGPQGVIYPMGYSLLISSKGSFINIYRYDSTYHSICYISCGTLAGVSISMGPQGVIYLSNGLLFLSARDFYKQTFTDITVHTTAFVTSVVEHWLE